MAFTYFKPFRGCEDFGSQAGQYELGYAGGSTEAVLRLERLGRFGRHGSFPVRKLLLGPELFEAIKKNAQARAEAEVGKGGVAVIPENPAIIGKPEMRAAALGMVFANCIQNRSLRTTHSESLRRIEDTGLPINLLNVPQLITHAVSLPVGFAIDVLNELPGLDYQPERFLKSAGELNESAKYFSRYADHVKRSDVPTLQKFVRHEMGFFAETFMMTHMMQALYPMAGVGLLKEPW